jgi:hypothetical protein
MARKMHYWFRHGGAFSAIMTFFAENPGQSLHSGCWRGGTQVQLASVYLTSSKLRERRRVQPEHADPRNGVENRFPVAQDEDTSFWGMFAIPEI